MIPSLSQLMNIICTLCDNVFNNGHHSLIVFRPILEDNTLLVEELEFLKFKKSIKKKNVSKATGPSAMEVDVEDGSELR